MRRLLLIVVLGTLAATAVAAGAGGDDGESYRVRAVFDNAAFVVPGEEVRIAGATVGEVESVDLSMPGEQVSSGGGGRSLPGKAVVVLRIDDPGFRNFRADAGCLVRPQSLLGEKFVECVPSQPRSATSESPPELAEIPDGQPGAGQHLLPLEQNGKAVDLDLVQNIMRRPYAERFRLILNELGAGLAARGEDLGEVIERANPALRQTDRVLAILASQNRELARLAADSDAVLAPLARERDHLGGFILNAHATGEAVLERRDALETGLRGLPAALRQVRLTMRELRALGDQGIPMFAELRQIAPDLGRATRRLGPLADAGTPALQSLGTAAAVAGPKLVEADPITVRLRDLTSNAKPLADDLASLLDSFSRTKGFQYLLDFIYNSVGSINGFDQYGHFLRANLQISSCLSYQTSVQSGCEALFVKPRTSTPAAPKAASKQKSRKKKKKKRRRGKRSRAAAAPPVAAITSRVHASTERGARLLEFLLGEGGR